MNDIQNSLFETMKQFSNYAKTTSEYTMTIEATIVNVVDAGLGQYLIELLVNSFSAFADNITYSVGDNVYVLIPNGDFTKNINILSLISPSMDNIIQPENDKIYYDISNNFIDTELRLIQLSSYETTKVENIIITENVSTLRKLINNFLNDNHRNFVFGFSVKTNLAVEQRNRGNYGITLSVPVIMNGTTGGGYIELV